METSYVIHTDIPNTCGHLSKYFIELEKKGVTTIDEMGLITDGESLKKITIFCLIDNILSIHPVLR